LTHRGMTVRAATVAGGVRRMQAFAARQSRLRVQIVALQAFAWNCGNQSFRCQGRSTSGENREARVPMRSTGTDRLVVATKAGNAAGAKGTGQVAAPSLDWKQEEALTVAKRGDIVASLT
jgi:hypothetical protein